MSDLGFRRDLATKFLLTVGSVVAATVILLFAFISRMSEQGVIGQKERFAGV